MSSNKAALKAIAASIQAGKFDDAVEKAQQLLNSDSQNYQANLFLGFALDKLGKLHEAEQAYLKATKSKPTDPQAWQGLIKLYEKQGATKVDAYHDAALNLAEIYMKADDKMRCQEVVDKYLAFAKNQGTRDQNRKSLEIILPSSPVYDYLEGRILHPFYTYQTIAQITEAEEKERMNKEIGERRTRLGAKINQVTLEVKREIFAGSPLNDIYTEIINWSTDDDIRHQFEEKQLQRCYDTLLVAPLGAKEEHRARVQELARGLVIIKHPFKLAWDINLEWQDPEDIEDMDANVLREYCSFFPTSGLAKVLKGYMTSEVSRVPAPPPPPPVSVSDDSEDDDDGGVTLDPSTAQEDRLLLMTEGLSEAPTSIIAHRAMSEYFAFLDEHESVVETARAGLHLVESARQALGVSFRNSGNALTALLGTALVFYQAPKNHPEARELFEELLKVNPMSSAALIGVGLIYEEDEDYPSAIEFLDRALSRDSDNIRVKAESSWVKALNGDYETGRAGLEECLARMDGTDLRTRDLRAQTQYRIGHCIWNIDTSRSARKDRNGAYKYFLAALKSNMNFAPAYTSLGIFYGDYTKDKKRARKCFQKAFELSPSEVVAAERLARTFADDGDWELVEAVAQRVVDSGKVKPAPGSKKPGISWPFSALGVAELNRQDYAKSVGSFQAALRISPNDYNSWVGLGESYHNSGRYVAATKAFTHAETLETEAQQQNGETWFAKYMLANVKRELGQYDDAITRYKEVMAIRSGEVGVQLALVQTYVENAWDSVDKGLFGQAAELAANAIQQAQALVKQDYSAFNIWKSLGDACSVFSWVQGKLGDYPHDVVQDILQFKDDAEAYQLFQDIDEITLESVTTRVSEAADDQSTLELTKCLHAAILAHKTAIHAAATDVHAQAVAYYNLGWTEYRAHLCLRPAGKRSAKYLKASIRAFKRAIELESGNAEFWSALGVATSQISPKVAQHSFVRSLFLNERSGQTWTNLGTLALLQNDVQMANEAFTRAQSADPDYAHAWVGQGLVALMMGDPAEARLLFTHALEISDASSAAIKRQYSVACFDHLLEAAVGSDIADLVQPIFALNQLQTLAPTEIAYTHLSTLFLERVADSAAALSLLSQIAGKIEAAYEVTESPADMSRFALAKADLARIQLANGQYEEAIESGDTALQLGEEDAGNNLTPEQRQRCRLSAHLTVGLAHYHNGNPSGAVSYIEAALEESGGNPDAVCLLAQVLWATGTSDARDKARDKLFEAIEAHPGHVQSVLLVGAISLIDGDSESLDAVTSDLHSLRTSSSITSEEQSMVGELLRATAAVSEGDPEKATLEEVQRDVFLFPHTPAGWSRLADAAGEEGQFAADMSLQTAEKADETAAELAGAYAGTGRVGDAQRAILYAPWCKEGWGTLQKSIAVKG